jgi:hypothetical protein
MAQRAADADGLRILKRKHAAAENDVEKVVESCWRDRAIGMSMLFRARACSPTGLVELLLKQLTDSPCPSPLLIDYLKESLMALWPDQPDLLDSYIKRVVNSFNPSSPFQFQAAAEICEVSRRHLPCLSIRVKFLLISKISCFLGHTIHAQFIM